MSKTKSIIFNGLKTYYDFGISSYLSESFGTHVHVSGFLT